MKFRDRIKELRRVPASELRPNPKNWRTHPTAQADALRGVLAEIGFADAAIARELPDGSLMLLDGHLRAETAGDADVPVLVLDVTEEEADKILATLDPLTAMADRDAEKLAALLGDLKSNSDTLAELVWPDYIVDPLLAADWEPPEATDDGPGEGGDKPRVQPIVVTPEQRETIDAAVRLCREAQGDAAITEGQAIEQICREYLDICPG